jgi:DNA-binding transcriptional LysR family regulator
MHSVLPRVLSEIQRNLPQIHTSMFELRNLDQVAALKDGSLDIGFIRTPSNVSGLVLQPIYSETLSVILPAAHPLSDSAEFHLAALAEEPFISFSRACAPGLFDSIIGLCNKEGFSPRIVHESSQINSVVRLVESGMGYSIVPTSVKYGLILSTIFHELDMYPERAELALAYHADNLTPTSERIIELILEMKFESEWCQETIQDSKIHKRR